MMQQPSRIFAQRASRRAKGAQRRARALSAGTLRFARPTAALAGTRGKSLP
jgi:hypothetical protein